MATFTTEIQRNLDNYNYYNSKYCKLKFKFFVIT